VLDTQELFLIFGREDELDGAAVLNSITSLLERLPAPSRPKPYPCPAISS